jgi:hypothetical protein
MKKYVFEAKKKLLDRPSQPNYLFAPPASVTFIADDETTALERADKALTEQYLGTGVLLSDLHLVRCDELPVDWNYGYGDERVWGDDITDMVGNAQIR